MGWTVFQGYVPVQVIGKNIQEFLHPDDQVNFMESLETVFRTAQSQADVNYRMIHTDGSWRWHTSTGIPLEDQQGNVIAYEGIAKDITEKKQMVTALEEANSFNRRLIENTQVAIYQTSQEGKFISVNPAFVKLAGYESAEDMIKSITNIGEQLYVNGEERNKLAKLLAEQGQVYGYEIQMKKKDGQPFWVLSSPSIVRDALGNTLFYEGTFIDITERKEAADEIMRKNEELQLHIAEKKKFFSIIARDLASPLQSFQWVTRFIVEEFPSLTADEIKKHVVSMKNSADKLQNLLEDLLEWSQMRRGVNTFQPKSLLFLNGVVPVVESVRDAAKNKMIRIGYDFPEDLTVIADAQMFASLLRNLVYNAIKFTQKSGRIIIAARQEPDNLITVSVSDNGIGMKPEMLHSLFQLDRLPSRMGTDGELSSGLGLLLCKEYVEQSGGNIWAESEEGIGTTVYFTIPKSPSGPLNI
jgi:PAS domain S-box-containing protein